MRALYYLHGSHMSLAAMEPGQETFGEATGDKVIEHWLDFDEGAMETLRSWGGHQAARQLGPQW